MSVVTVIIPRKDGWIPIQSKFKKRQMLHELVRREGDVAIFKVTSPGGHSAWDVAKIQRHNGVTIAGNYCPPAEFYPASEQWGVLAWTFCSEEAATLKFQQLTKTKRSKAL